MIAGRILLAVVIFIGVLLLLRVALSALVRRSLVALIEERDRRRRAQNEAGA